MPLIPYFKARRIWKAKRAASLRGRPAWQTVLPDTKQGRDSYAIAAKHEDMFAKAFMAAMAEMITPEIERDFREAWKSGSPAAVINSIPYFDENPDSKVWAKFLGRLGKAYATVIQAAGDAASRDLKTQFGVKQTFTTLPPPDQADDLVGEVTEGLVKKADAWRQAAAGMTVDVNPYSIKWIEDHGLDLVQQGISVQQKKVVTNIIQSSMEQGLRPTDAISEIKANIGLTDRAYNATVSRRELHLDAGYSPAEADALTAVYRDTLLAKRAKLIARTETIQAQSQGRRDAWKLAVEQGNMPQVQRQWITSPPSSDPNAPCAICLDLDGKKTTLEDPYESIEGPIQGPTAHPGCRCTEVLVRAEGDGNAPN